MPTMRDVAEKAGVSYTTVSYVLNQRNSARGIGEETRRRVLQVASELDYRPNQLARAVVTGNNPVLGFVARDPKAVTEFTGSILSGVLEAAGSDGYSVKVFYVPEGENQQPVLADIIEKCLAWRLAGMVVVSLCPALIEKLGTALKPHSIPLASVENVRTPWETLEVRSNEAQGIRIALEHLAALGHRRIAYLAAAEGDVTADRRAVMFAESVAALGLTVPPQIVRGDWWAIEANRRAVGQLLEQSAGERPTAILCCGDPAAQVTINRARALGIRVPDDLSVIGFGDYAMAAYADPALTTVAQPFREIGRTATSRLIASLKTSSEPGSDPVPAQDAALDTVLVVRDSTAPPPSFSTLSNVDSNASLSASKGT